MTPQARMIILEVAAARGIAPIKLVTKCRSSRVVQARIEVAKRLVARRYSSTKIGAILNKDHTTILFYLGWLKKKPPVLRWHRPRVLHLNCRCRRCYFPTPRRVLPPLAPRYLVPYAGWDYDYHWQERP